MNIFQNDSPAELIINTANYDRGTVNINACQPVPKSRAGIVSKLPDSKFMLCACYSITSDSNPMRFPEGVYRKRPNSNYSLCQICGDATPEGFCPSIRIITTHHNNTLRKISLKHLLHVSPTINLQNGQKFSRRFSITQTTRYAIHSTVPQLRSVAGT